MEIGKIRELLDNNLQGITKLKLGKKLSKRSVTLEEIKFTNKLEISMWNNKTKVGITIYRKKNKRECANSKR